MDLSLAGKNALVCGSSKGIGRATAQELASLGANVTLVARSPDLLSEALGQLDRVAPEQDHDFLVADFSDSADLRKKILGLTAGKVVHILINNTGGPPGGAIVEAKAEEFVTAFHNHLICNHMLVQAVLPGMKKVGYGRIVNIISTSVKVPIPNLGVSNTTRAAVANWAKTLAGEVGQFGITVNNVLPGFTKTSRLDSIVEARAKKQSISLDEMTAKLEAGVPMKRFADPVEVGAAVAFLASPAASYINGINLPVDGGRTGSL